MQWKFWRFSQPKGIPAKVERVLVSEFHLEPGEVRGLRMLDQRGRLVALTGQIAEDRRVKFIRIFDPSAIEEERWSSLTYDNLKSPAGRKALRFEGHLERDGSVHLADRRPPRRVIKPITLDMPVVPSPSSDLYKNYAL